MPSKLLRKARRGRGTFTGGDAVSSGVDDMKLSAIHACLPSSDLDATAAFYAKLGFTGHRRWSGYLMLCNDRHEIHFSLEEGSIAPQAGVYLRVCDIEKWAAPFAAAVEAKPWGMREFALTDPDGNHIRIGEDSQGCP